MSSFPSKFPHTINFRIQEGQVTQQITKQGDNQYTVKTWVHAPTAQEVSNANSLTRAEAIEQIDYQSEYAIQLLERYAQCQKCKADAPFRFIKPGTPRNYREILNFMGLRDRAIAKAFGYKDLNAFSSSTAAPRIKAGVEFVFYSALYNRG